MYESDAEMAVDERDTKADEEEQDEENDVEPDDGDESEELSPPPLLVMKPRLKIKLKLPQILSPNDPSSRAASTPSGEGHSQPPSRHEYVESEDDDEAVGGSTRPMTSRQAVLASVVDSSHVSLCMPDISHLNGTTRYLTYCTAESSRKKKQLTEEEIALRREETARKRRNLSEKKLEDEKMETINRLLKKQSKSKNKRNVLSTADDRTPVSVTPAIVSSTRDGSQPPEGEIQEPVEIIPTMYRWISTTNPPEPSAMTAEDGAIHEGTDVKMRLMFSVPVCALPSNVDAHMGGQLRVPLAMKPICDVSGCGRSRKYRLVKDWKMGACGMDHLKLLERQLA
ncbi:hypothetical protein J3A83DRAFT_4092148 [Scleroderma citrinum]